MRMFGVSTVILRINPVRSVTDVFTRAFGIQFENAEILRVTYNSVMAQISGYTDMGEHQRGALLGTLRRVPL